MLGTIVSYTKKISPFLIITLLLLFSYNYITQPQNFSQDIPEKEILIIVPSYNNKDWYQKNLDSLVSQKYSNYRILYINDCSSDGTGQLVSDYIQKNHLESKIMLINNEKNQGALENLYHAIHKVPDHVIIVTVDGDDWLKHDRVLAQVNCAYQNDNIWMTYGQFEYYPLRPGVCKTIPSYVIQNNIFRKSPWYSTHLRTFYAWLFKSIKREDLLHEGKFIQVTWDMAFMFPMLEMAAERHAFIKDVLYVYNENNALCDHALRRHAQIETDHIIRSKLPYCKLGQADCLIFSYDRPLQLFALLESMQKYITGLCHISIIYRCSTQEFEQQYQKIKNQFPCISFIQQGTNPRADFKKILLDTLYTSQNEYILFAVDDIIVKDFVDIRRCIAMMEHEHAHGFYLRLGKNIVKYDEEPNQSDVQLQKINEDVYAWTFGGSPTEWRYAHSVDMTLYNKQAIKQDLFGMNYFAPNSFEALWALRVDNSKKGLCFENSKIINIPINRVQNEINNRSMNLYTAQELLSKFIQGYKIDIAPLHKIANKYPHTEYKPNFILR